jgi:hypothetical protein
MLGPEIRGSAAKDAEDASMEPESELNVGPDQRLKLGKALMLSGDCAPWSGALRLDDAQDPTYVRFETYSRDE